MVTTILEGLDPLHPADTPTPGATLTPRSGTKSQQWAFGSMRGSPGVKAYYKALKDRKIGHQAALRQLGNRWVGILHGCLKTGQLYDENKAWSHQSSAAA